MVLLAEPTAALPLNIPRTFLPERRLLAQLLSFAARNGSGDKESISAETGIPTGKSSGKVVPMIHYAQGMGLVRVEKAAGLWRLSLTALGQTVLREDAFLSEAVTLWLLHLMLCRRCGLQTPATGVADAWFTLFAEGQFRLGLRFTYADYRNFLIERYGNNSYLESLASVVLRSYLEESSLDCSASAPSPLMVEGEKSKPIQEQWIVRQSAPVKTAFFPAYTAYFYWVWDELFAGETQIALAEFARQTRCLAIMNWSDAMAAPWLAWMTDQDLIHLDRHTGTPMMLRLRDTGSVVNSIYSELL